MGIFILKRKLFFDYEAYAKIHGQEEADKLHAIRDAAAKKANKLRIRSNKRAKLYEDAVKAGVKGKNTKNEFSLDKDKKLFDKLKQHYNDIGINVNINNDMVKDHGGSYYNNFKYTDSFTRKPIEEHDIFLGKFTEPTGQVYDSVGNRTLLHEAGHAQQRIKGEKVLGRETYRPRFGKNGNPWKDSAANKLMDEYIANKNGRDMLLDMGYSKDVAEEFMKSRDSSFDTYRRSNALKQHLAKGEKRESKLSE